MTKPEIIHTLKHEDWLQLRKKYGMSKDQLTGCINGRLEAHTDIRVDAYYMATAAKHGALSMRTHKVYECIMNNFKKQAA